MVKSALIALTILAVAAVVGAPSASGQSAGPVYELRIYTAVQGKLPAVVARLKDHAMKLFEKHGMQNIGYWIPTDPPQSQSTVYYILKHKSRAAATASWDAFRKDPEWLRVQAETEANGKILDKTESVFMSPTEFSKLK